MNVHGFLWFEGYSCEAKKTKKARKPKQRRAKASVALVTRDWRRWFLFTGTRLDQGETKRK
ncbi:hypothetical protein EBT31_02760 [bacterium]|nr:hypothetical protein [bacterium]